MLIIAFYEDNTIGWHWHSGDKGLSFDMEKRRKAEYGRGAIQRNSRVGRGGSEGVRGAERTFVEYNCGFYFEINALSLMPAPSSSLARSCVFIANVPLPASVIALAFVSWHAQWPQRRKISPTFTVALSVSLNCSKHVAETKLCGTFWGFIKVLHESQIGGTYKRVCVLLFFFFILKAGGGVLTILQAVQLKKEKWNLNLKMVTIIFLIKKWLGVNKESKQLLLILNLDYSESHSWKWQLFIRHTGINIYLCFLSNSLLCPIL